MICFLKKKDRKGKKRKRKGFSAQIFNTQISQSLEGAIKCLCRSFL